MATRHASSVLQFIRHLAEREAAGELADADVLERFARTGDEQAFGVLLERYGPLVLGLCRRILGHEQDAEDAFQATFLVLARRARAIRRTTSVGSWLYGVAYRVALKARQRASRRRARETALVDAAGPRPSDTWLWQDVRPVLDEEVRRLPDKYRAAFVLCHLEGATNEQAAARLGCPLGTVLSRLARARQRLRTQLMRRGVALSTATGILLAPADAPAALSPALFRSTVRAALGFAGGARIAAGAGAAVSLAQGVLATMILIRLSVCALLVIGFGALGFASLPGAPAGAAAPAEAPAPAADRLLDKVAEEWARVVERKQDGNPWMDKVSFAGAYDDLKQAAPFSPDELKAAYDKLVKLAREHEKDPDYSWRVQQLLADVQWDLGNKDRAIEHGKKALDVYPAKAYADPSKHSSYQHLANDVAGKIAEAKGVGEGEAFILERFQSARPFQYFFANYWQELYAKKNQADRYPALLKKVAAVYQEKMATDPKNKTLYQRYLNQLEGERTAAPAVAERKVGGDGRKTYYLLKPTSPPAGAKSKLVILLPGGHGQAKEFLPFLEELFAALGGEYVFAVVSAPQWTKWQAENIVWPTAADRIPEAAFTTEALVTAVYHDVIQRDAVDPKAAFLFGWSSGGPAVYATALAAEAPPLAGYYVLASVFRPEQVAVENARGKRFYLQQGEDDRVTAVRFARRAADELKKHGAAVHLDTFPGGHGFAMPDRTASVKAALGWLGGGE